MTRRYEVSPRPSQPINRVIRLGRTTNRHIAKMKDMVSATKRGMKGSSPI